MNEVKFTSDLVLVLENGNRVNAEELKKVLPETVSYQPHPDPDDGYPRPWPFPWPWPYEKALEEHVPFWVVNREARMAYLAWLIEWWKGDEPKPHWGLLFSENLFGLSVADITVLYKHGFVRNVQLSQFQLEQIKKQGLL